MFSIKIFNNLVIALCPYQILDLIQYNNLMGIIHIDLWTANLIKILCPDGKTKQLDLFLEYPTRHHLIKFFLAFEEIQTLLSTIYNIGINRKNLSEHNYSSKFLSVSRLSSLSTS